MFALRNSLKANLDPEIWYNRQSNTLREFNSAEIEAHRWNTQELKEHAIRLNNAAEIETRTRHVVQRKTEAYNEN